MGEDRRHDPRVVDRQLQARVRLAVGVQRLRLSNADRSRRVHELHLGSYRCRARLGAAGANRVPDRGVPFDQRHHWTSMGVDVVPMVATVYVGIATTSHNTTRRHQGGVDQPQADRRDGTGSTLESTTDRLVDRSREWRDVTRRPRRSRLTASASDTDGTVSKVEFYSGTTLLGTDTTAPYSYTWSSVAAGTYSLSAVAYDSAGAKASSPASSVTVGTSSSTAVPAPWTATTLAAPP